MPIIFGLTSRFGQLDGKRQSNQLLARILSSLRQGSRILRSTRGGQDSRLICSVASSFVESLRCDRQV